MEANRRYFIYLLISVAQILTGCKEGIPSVAQLRSLDGFHVDQSVISVSSKTSPAFTVTGQCDSKFHDIEISSDGGLTWKKVAELSAIFSVACTSNQTFSANLDFATHPLSADKWNSAGSYNSVLLRATSDSFGYSEPHKLRLDSSKKSAFLTDGHPVGTVRVSQTGGYTLSDQIRFENSMSEIVNGYKLEGSVTW